MNNNISIKQVFQRRSFSQISVALLYMVHLMPLLIFVMAINARIGLSFLNENLKLIISVILVLLSITCFYKRLRWWDYVVVLGIGGFCLWSPNIYPQTTMAVGLFAPHFVLSCLPLYFVGATVRLQEDVDLFIVIGRIGVIVNILYSVLALAGITGQAGDFSEERQGMAYNLLPMVIITLWSGIKHHNELDLSLSIIGVLFLFSMGARGPVMAFVLFLFGFLFLFKDYKNAMFVRIVIIFLLWLVYLIFDVFLELLSNFASSLGMSTRIYEMIQDTEMISTENRDWIYDKVLDELYSNPIYGHGFFYDRIIFGMEENSYAHNVFYEIFLDFGFYIGTALFVVFFGMMIWSMIKYWKTPVSTLLFAFFCGYFVMFIFSGSIFRTPTFWLFLGIVVSTFRSKPQSVLESKRQILKTKFV